MGHLTEEQLLLLSTHELNPDEAYAARQHIASCASCGARFDDLSDFRDSLSRKIIGQSLLGLSGKFKAAEATLGWRRGLRFGGTIAASVAILLSGFLWLTSPVPLTAQEVLSSALDAEQRHPQQVSTVRVTSSRSGCSAARNGNQWIKRANAASCERFDEAIRSLKWDWDNPLSTRSFNRWRDSLTDKTDRVTEGPDSIRVETRTVIGELKFVTLTVKRSDYALVELQLGVEGFDTLSLKAEPAPEALSVAKVIPVSPEVWVPERSKIDEPLIDTETRMGDEREVAVWETLHRLHADSGYETLVRREGNEVRVIGLAATEERRAELEQGLGLVAGVRVGIAVFGEPSASEFLSWVPPRGGSETGPALLEAELTSLLGSGERIQNAKNTVLDTSQKVAGLARVQDELQQMLTRLADCPCAPRLRSINSAYAAQSRQLLFELERQLLVLFQGLSFSRTAPLSRRDARRLDAALIKLFDASSEGDSADEEMSIVRQILQ